MRKLVKKTLLFILFFQIHVLQFGQIIADHTVVDKYDDIPQEYINKVKEMLLVVVGESHAWAYFDGLTLLEAANPTYQFNHGSSGGPSRYSNQYLRGTKQFWGDLNNTTGWLSDHGEEDWWTNATAKSRIKAGITYCNETYGAPISALGFGWCYDAYRNNGSATVDPVYGVHWFGNSIGSPEGDKAWGLDAADFSITGNSVSMDNYLAATQEYISYCASHGYPTKVFYTTGPVDDGSGESFYQAYIKYEYIRNYIKADPSRILFDYADILCYDDNGTLTTNTWNGHTFPKISNTNLSPITTGHISNAGAIRLAKAMWWMLARMAGWNGGTSNVPVTSVTVTSSNGSSSITANAGTLQLNAGVLPDNASNKTITWSIQNGTGSATINQTGLVTAVSNGTVTARATANDGSGVSGTFSITISGQIVRVAGISVTGAGGLTTITSDNGTLQLTASILPVNATNKNVTWGIQNGTGEATISSTGLVTAISNGTVTASATANDGSGVVGTLVITMTNQIVPVTAIHITSNGGGTTISTDDGTLQLIASVTPVNATNPDFSWTIQNISGQASISNTGLVTAMANGTVIARATASDGSGVFGTFTITITNQIVPVTAITISGGSQITSDNGTLQLSASIEPLNASNPSITWSIQYGTGEASISNTGLVTALSNGTVIARATANDGSGAFGTQIITISNQIVPVIGIVINGGNTITADDGTLQLNATISPVNATIQTVTWSVSNGTGMAVISNSGLVTAINNGTVTVTATANDGSGIHGTIEISISGQLMMIAGISVTGAGGSNIISLNEGTLQLYANVTPENASNKSVTWSVINGTGQATISETGLLTAINNGTVTVTATANDGSGISGSLVVIITDQYVPVSGITIHSEGNITNIQTDDGTLQLTALVEPANATNPNIIWTVQQVTGNAVISPAGLLTASQNGLVTVTATAADGSGISGTFDVTISNQIIPVSTIHITGNQSITTDNGEITLSANVLPVNATDPAVIWSVVNGTGMATVSSSGIVTAIANGTVTVIATAHDGSEVSASIAITITNQIVPVASIQVEGENGISIITTASGTLQLQAVVAPAYSTNQTVTWSLENVTGGAVISPGGLVTAVSNGNVMARATANDGSGITGSLQITISDQIVRVTDITITGAGGVNTITADDGSLQLTAHVAPANASNLSVTWSISSGNEYASISEQGLITAITNGTITATATANDGSGTKGNFTVLISNQVIVVSGINITGGNSISTDNGSLQMTANILPANATNKTVTWSLVNGSGRAGINANGLVTAVTNGTVTVTATANDGSGVYNSHVITISNQVVEVTRITISGGNAITTDDGVLQLSAVVEPSYVTDPSVTWRVQNGTGLATISPSGLLYAIGNGTVTAIATAQDGSGVYGTHAVTISGQTVMVAGISVTGALGSTRIITDNGTLQLNAVVSPSNATNKTVTWSIQNGTGQASISNSGLVTAINNGTVTARATASDGSGISGSLVISITNQVIPITSISVTASGGSNIINTDNGSLQLTATILPANATNRSIAWSIQNGTGQASISNTGLVTAMANGTVTARATANDGSGAYGVLNITISNQVIAVSDILVTGSGGISYINTNAGSLQLNALVNPSNATNRSVTWSVRNGTGQASISNTGLLTAISNGNVTATARANDGSGVSGSLVIQISNQIVTVTDITITGSSTITTDDGTSQLSASVTPANASVTSVTWSVHNGTGQAEISSRGLVRAVSNGTVTVRATANDGSGIYKDYVVTITGQVIRVAGISVNSSDGKTAIQVENGTLQLNAVITPADATNKNVTWSVQNGTGEAVISNNGLLTAVANGTITARATANDGSSVYGTLVITITNQVVLVKTIIVNGEGGMQVIGTNSTLQLNAVVLPAHAEDKSIAWSIQNGTGSATINSSGLVTARTEGTVIARATSNDGSGVYGILTITISDHIIPVETIVLYGKDFHTSIETPGGTLQLNASVFPTNATVKSVTWSLSEGTTCANISASGLLTGMENGEVTVMAMAADGSGVSGIVKIEIKNQDIQTGIKEEKSPLYALYYNATGFVVKMGDDFPAENLQIYNMAGQLILQRKITDPEIEFENSMFLPGVYILVLRTRESIETTKVRIP